MKFTIFQSEKGDCLLLESDDDKLILADGGMKASYQEHVAPALGRLRKAGRDLDLIYLSHIDQDHIAGVLQLMNDLVAWRVYDHQSSLGNEHVAKPTVPRPPEVKAIWHNAFHEQVGKNGGKIADMLAASASILMAARTPKLVDIAEDHEELALSQMEAMQLCRRVGAGQLNIPLNPEFEGKLMYARENIAPFQLGELSIHLIGPFEADLEKLRADWNTWLGANQSRVEELRRRAVQDEEDLGNDVTRIMREMEITAEVFGDRTKVTPPNLASLMFYVEEPRQGGAARRYIFTGDGHWKDILKGLSRHGKLDQQSGRGIHVDVLKGQHHGSEHNWHEDFVQAVTADHYIFCGNGEHENPDEGVIRMVLNSRIGPASKRSPNAETNRPFTIWCNCSHSVPGKPDNQRHMKKIENIVRAARQRSNKVRYRFLKSSSFAFSV
jgi:hypothetical protein